MTEIPPETEAPGSDEPAVGLTIGEAGERRVLSALTVSTARTIDDEQPQRLPDGSERRFDDIVVGTGDDAAVIDSSGPTVISTDTAVEGRHFRLDWTDPRTIGARAVVAAVADVAAMGGRPTGVVVSIAAPAETPVAVITEINAGIIESAHAHGARLLGGDLVAAEQIVLTITAIGVLDGALPVTLSGARPGDVLAVSGPLGAAAAGFAVLAAGKGDDAGLLDRHAELVAAHRLPSPALDQGPLAARTAHAMTDVSDGLVEELITLSQAAGVRVLVTSELIPRSDRLLSAAVELDVDEDRWVLAGGEDHELLASFAGVEEVPSGWTVIGTVEEGAGVLIDGAAPEGLHGWQSFDAGDD